MKKIGFIGAGNMAGALIRGFLASQRYKPDDMWVADPVDSQVRRLKRAHKVDGTRDNRLLVKQSQTVILAVKPQMMAAVLEEIRSETSPKKLFVSIAAGFPLRRLETGLGGQARVVRVMPNTPGPGRAGHLGGGRGQQGHPDRSEADPQALQGGRRGGVDHRRGPARRGDGALGQRARLRLPLRGEPDRGRGARRPARRTWPPSSPTRPSAAPRRCWARAVSRHASCATW